MRQSFRKYSLAPACNNQLENTPGQPCATVTLKMLLDNRVRQWIKKYSWTPACDSQLENTSGHPCDSHFPKGVSAFSQSFPLKHWNKTNVIERISHRWDNVISYHVWAISWPLSHTGVQEYIQIYCRTRGPGVFSNWLSHAGDQEYFQIDCCTRVSRSIF